MKKIFLHITALLFIGSVNAQDAVTIPCSCQVWDVKNLDVTTYRDGTPIPQVQDDVAWSKLTTGAWCYYTTPEDTNGTIYNSVYGKLYNWYAVNDKIHGGLAPAGYHIPSDKEWTTLETVLMNVAPLGALADQVGDKMKERGTIHWQETNTPPTANNNSGFTALPGGYRAWNFIPPSLRPSSFIGIRVKGFWWSSTGNNKNSSYAFARYLTFNQGGLYGGPVVKRIGFNKRGGYSVRCIKDCQ